MAIRKHPSTAAKESANELVKSLGLHAGIKQLIDDSHGTAVEKGWWGPDGKDERPVAEMLCLMHSELSEALEEDRNGKGLNDIYYGPDGNKPEGFPIELADVVIRIADLCGRYNVDLAKALEIKLAYNKTRSYRHGGKKC